MKMYLQNANKSEALTHAGLNEEISCRVPCSLFPSVHEVYGLIDFRKSKETALCIRTLIGLMTFFILCLRAADMCKNILLGVIRK